MADIFGKKHILVVDDDPVQLRLIRGFLEEEYEVTLVPSGKMAIEYLIDHQPDLILLDYEMPLYNGPTVLKIIRSKEKSMDIPVIFLTGASDKDTVIECLSYNPAGYMIKPVTQEDLISKLNSVFDPSCTTDGSADEDDDEKKRQQMRKRIIKMVNEKKNARMKDQIKAAESVGDDNE